MKLLTAAVAGLAFIAAPALAQETNNSMTAAQHTRVRTTTTTEHIQGTVPVTHHHRVVHHRRIIRHRIIRHHPVRHHHHVVKQTTVTTTTKS